ncbi:hypothetical protein ASG92_06950 [Arthrobacter sp. Soil736]|nr:sigma-70 domain-containing protein [Arthrobacter sp. Soil736]KRE53265.1 hypothetical protein ASG92_06950 [Arthrobacter sp. Soil736]
MLRTVPDLTQTLGRVSSTQELAAELGVSAEDVREAHAAASSMHPDSLDTADPANVAQAILFVLSQPAGCEIREMLICHEDEGSWP